VPEIEILSEQEIEIYSAPGKQVKQRVITYKAEGLAPRTLWLDSSKLADAKYQLDNPGKPIPPEVQTKGDAARKAAIMADIKRQSELPQARKL
jgi:hypothetical protein